jgi:hypothetical protein
MPNVKMPDVKEDMHEHLYTERGVEGEEQS